MILNADALHIPLADGTVQTCVTSPPYFGLRDYGTATWEGGNPECDHLRPRLGGNGASSPINGGGSDRDESVGLQQYKGVCLKCGAVRIDRQIGLEETPDAYVEKLVQVFREVRRVLRDDGTLWLNLGDSYARLPSRGKKFDGGTYVGADTNGARADIRPEIPDGLKEKDMVGIPWMVAFALRADGWYLRSDIIWHKKNPMPESVTDRPTKSHEYIFLLSKSAKYYYDAEAIKEPNSETSGKWGKSVITKTAEAQGDGRHGKSGFMGREISHEETIEKYYTDGRNKRDVWEVATQPYPEAHFATYPPKLIEPCILAGSREGDIVLDPFSGSGTTGQVAIQYRRRYVGLELNMDYIGLSRVRTTTDVMLPLFAGVTA